MSASLAVVAAANTVLAAPNGKAGPVALFVIVLLGVAASFLFRSMSRHLRQVPEEFAPPTPEGAELPGEGRSEGAGRSDGAGRPDVARPAPPEKTGDAS